MSTSKFFFFIDLKYHKYLYGLVLINVDVFRDMPSDANGNNKIISEKRNINMIGVFLKVSHLPYFITREKCQTNDSNERTSCVHYGNISL